MKSSLRKLRGFTFSKHASKDNPIPDQLNTAAEESEELRAGMQVLEDMREEYDGLLAVAQSTSGSAYDFARSIQEMALYMMERFGHIGHGETENIFSLLGKAQHEISKFLDLYAAHLSQTIIKPTQNLLKELQSVEELKGQHDEKRQSYIQIRARKPKGKGILKERGDNAINQQLLALKNELNDQAMVLGLRFQSLKLGRELSLVTQAARHHTAQVHLFGKSLDSLSAVEPIVKQLSRQHNIDRTLSDGDVANMQFDVKDFDDGDGEESMPSTPDSIQAYGSTKQWEGSTKSAPISASLYLAADSTSLERPGQRALTTYALPPLDASKQRWNWQAAALKKTENLRNDEVLEPSKKSIAARASTFTINDIKGPRMPKSWGASAHDSRQASLADEANRRQQWEQHDLFMRRVQLSSRSSNHALRVAAYKEGVVDSSLSVPRYSYSGPLAANKSNLGLQQTTTSGGAGVLPVVSYPIDPLYKSGPVNRSSTWTHASKISPFSSPPPHLSPPVISELYKLPTPPAKTESSIAHSVSLEMENKELTGKSVPTSPLPHPFLVSVKKSRSIPSSVKFSRDLQQVKILESPSLDTSQVSQTVESP